MFQVLDPLDAGLSFEGLIDAVLCLYEHCNSKELKEYILNNGIITS